MTPIGLGIGGCQSVGYVVNTADGAAMGAAWPLDWAVPDVASPTILYQFKGAPTQDAMVTNLGAAGASGDGYAEAPAALPLAGGERGAIFRGPRNQASPGDGIMTGFYTLSTGTFYCHYSNVRLVGDIEALAATSQRSGYTSNPRSYFGPSWAGGTTTVFGSGSAFSQSAFQLSGSIGLSPGVKYLNATPTAFGTTTWLNSKVVLGGTLATSSQWWGNSGGNWFCCDVQLFAYWSSTISAAAMSAWDTAVKTRLEL